MPYTAVTPQRAATPPNAAPAAITFTTPTASGAGNGIKFRNTGDQLVLIRNQDASDCTVTAVTPGTQSGLAVSDYAHVIPAGTNIGRPVYLSPWIFNQQSGADEGLTYLEFSHVNNIFVAVIELPRRGT